MKIKIEFSEDGLWGHTDPTEYNQQQSEANFRESLENHLYNAYPTANTEVVKSNFDRVQVNGQTDHAEAPWINQLIDRVYNGDDWLVA